MKAVSRLCQQYPVDQSGSISYIIQHPLGPSLFHLFILFIQFFLYRFRS
jgi:hypothetical protein